MHVFNTLRTLLNMNVIELPLAVADTTLFAQKFACSGRFAVLLSCRRVHLRTVLHSIDRHLCVSTMA